MKYIFNLTIILLLVQLFFVPCFSENHTDDQSNIINQSSNLYSGVSLTDLKIVCENQTILVTIFIQNNNEDYITISPDIVFKKEKSISKMRLKENYEYILVPQKTTHVILKFSNDDFTDGKYIVEVDLKSEEKSIIYQEYFLTVNGENFSLSKKNQNETSKTQSTNFDINSIFIQFAFFVDNYGLYILVIITGAVFYMKRKKISQESISSLRTNDIKKIKMTSVSEEQKEENKKETVMLKRRKNPLIEKDDFWMTKAQNEIDELNQLKLKGWIDERKYNLLKRKIASVLNNNSNMSIEEEE
ncbi:MAG: hypothetical protein KAI55_01875 [Candidatus Aenigmarchaeota archaeon]|nr:hypothetical protein [Candidatus Aenigmarchaeota archaeon]